MNANAMRSLSPKKTTGMYLRWAWIAWIEMSRWRHVDKRPWRFGGWGLGGMAWTLAYVTLSFDTWGPNNGLGFLRADEIVI